MPYFLFKKVIIQTKLCCLSSLNSSCSCVSGPEVLDSIFQRHNFLSFICIQHFVSCYSFQVDSNEWTLQRSRLLQRWPSRKSCHHRRQNERSIKDEQRKVKLFNIHFWNQLKHHVYNPKWTGSESWFGACHDVTNFHLNRGEGGQVAPQKR